MIDRRIDISQTGKLWILLAGFGAILYILWQLSNSIAGGSPRMAMLLGAGFIAFFVAGKIAGNWRSGVSLFFVWLVFEDFIRKYMGNNMYVYFAKDVLVLVTYVSLLSSGTRRDLRFFRPPFRYALGLFFLLALVQVFNPFSPSIFYGLLGLKLYFYYVPLMFVGYAMMRTVDDLRRFLVLTMEVAGVVAGVGILQTIFGLDFLNPHGGADIEELSHLTRYTPSGLAVIRPPSVFVSDGRFAAYIIVVFILGLGAAGFLMLRRGPGRTIVFGGVGLTALAAAMTGSRGTFIYVIASGLLLSFGMIWGAPKRVGEGYRLVKAIRQSFIYVGLAVAMAVTVFPNVFAAHLSFYRETLTPGSENFEGRIRTWDYPVEELKLALSYPDWEIGYGAGTTSLGAQYVSRILGAPPSIGGVENGYGDLILQFGIPGPLLWLLWASILVFAVLKKVLTLKGTWAFPLALGILWYSFLMLFPFTWGGMTIYEDFVTNAYFWLMVGILFRLPELVREAGEQAQVAPVHGR
jgi:hypothetical protein